MPGAKHEYNTKNTKKHANSFFRIFMIFFFLFWSSPEIRNSFTSFFTATLGKEPGHSLLLRFHLVPVTTLGLLCMLSPLEFNVTLQSRYGSVHLTNVDTDWNFKRFNIKNLVWKTRVSLWCTKITDIIH